MKATYEIIAKRGFEGLVIESIAATADFGYGSFYNHFTSKDAIIRAVIDAACAHIKAVYECIAGLPADSAEALARDLRMCLSLSRTDKVWGWFVIRTFLSDEELRESIRGSIQRRIYTGLKDGAFKHEDIEMAYETIGGLLLLGTLKLVSGEVLDDYLDKVVSTALKTLGMCDTKIREVMSKPLPEIDLPPFLDAPKQRRAVVSQPSRKQIMQILKASPRGIKREDIIENSGLAEDTAKKQLARLVKVGKIVKIARGNYALPSPR